jgi:enoyl-CoA hydratase/carnithine racemase
MISVYSSYATRSLLGCLSACREIVWGEIVQVIVLCGEGSHFCAGLDFSTFTSIARQLADPALCPGQARNSLMQTIRFMQVCTIPDCFVSVQSCMAPVVAAVCSALLLQT